MGDFPYVQLPFNLELLIVFVLLFFIIPTSKQDLDEAFGQNGQKTHWNIKDDSQGCKGRYELSFSKSYRVHFWKSVPLSDESAWLEL